MRIVGLQSLLKFPEYTCTMTKSKEQSFRVFLSYARENMDVALEIYNRLKIEGWIEPWLDTKKILPGQDWNIEIEDAIETSNAVIVLLSNVLVGKFSYIQKEIRAILSKALERPEGAIFVIPVRLDDCKIPHDLKYVQYIDYFPAENKNHAYHQIIKSIKSSAEYLEAYFSLDADPEKADIVKKPSQTIGQPPGSSKLVENDSGQFNEESTLVTKVLNQHKRNLYRLLEKKSKYGIDVPLSILNQIDDEEKEIRRLENLLESL